MMKMSGRVTRCWAALLLVLTAVSAVHERLNSIRHLKKVDFGQSVPKHSLLLLHWFANEVLLDNNDVIWLTFNPRDFGSHRYYNRERLLDLLPEGFTYYTVGNLNQWTATPFPSYVVGPPRGYEGRNRDRILIRVQNGAEQQRIDQVFITQHYGNSQGTEYDPDHTYQITNNLLRQIRLFSVSDDNPQSLSDLIDHFGSTANEYNIRNTWGDLAYLGLLVFIVIEEKYLSNQNIRVKSNNRPGHSSRVESNNGPGHSSRVESNNGAGHSSRVESNNGPGHSSRVESNNGAGHSSRVESNNGAGHSRVLQDHFILEIDNQAENNYTQVNNKCWKWVKLICMCSILVVSIALALAIASILILLSFQRDMR